MKNAIVILILFAIAGICSGLMDQIKFHDTFSGSHFWSAESWKNVYKNGDPAQGSRFFLSTSLFAPLCDGWHLLKEIMISSICLAAVWAYSFKAWIKDDLFDLQKLKVKTIGFLVLRIVFSLFFNLVWL